jgi:transcription-repair coupling factor (superfamily II helicase)
MLEFYAGDVDVLVCTTIIESGLDIPNVNTLIVDQSDRFGLAQLYQLRGRVGRSDRQAYAYLTWTPHKRLTEPAEKRLAAIEEFTELGVGFQIAMRDMEIRGTGNILGKEQHGCISAIGFDLYCQLLEETVRKLRGEPVEEERAVEIRCSVDSYIPADYVPVESQRIAIYKKLSALRRADDINEIREELNDRYGAPPQPVRNILNIARLRVLASRADVEKIVIDGNGVEFVARDGSLFSPPTIAKVRKKFPSVRRTALQDDKTIRLTFNDWGEQDQLDTAIKVLEELIVGATSSVAS